MTWVLTRGMATVRDEFNRVFPDRDKASDGTIGNTAHQASASGHNPDLTGNAEYKDGDTKDEVRAIDIDADLRTPGVTMEQVVQHILTRARAGTYVPFRYLIYNRRIWRRATGWKTETYTGSSPHTSHVHLSGDYTQAADEWAGTLDLATLTGGDDMPYTEADLTRIIRTAVHGCEIGRSGVTIGVGLERLLPAPSQLAAIRAELVALAGKDPVNEAEVVAELTPLLLATLTPQAIADAVMAAQSPELAKQVVDELAAQLGRRD